MHATNVLGLVRDGGPRSGRAGVGGTTDGSVLNRQQPANHDKRSEIRLRPQGGQIGQEDSKTSKTHDREAIDQEVFKEVSGIGSLNPTRCRCPFFGGRGTESDIRGLVRIPLRVIAHCPWDMSYLGVQKARGSLMISI